MCLGFMIPRPSLDKGSVRESHLTLARVLEAFPPYEVSYHSSNLVAHPRIGVPIAAMYHIEENNIWLTIRILLVKERLHLPQTIIFPFRVSMSFSKLALVGSRKPIWMPKYRTPCPSGIHLSPTSCPPLPYGYGFTPIYFCLKNKAE